jgi:hypothetical protein
MLFSGDPLPDVHWRSLAVEPMTCPPNAPKLSEARRHATAARKNSANGYSANVLPVIDEIQRSGIKSLRGIARALAARGLPTARGGAWTPVQVSDILRRAG